MAYLFKRKKSRIWYLVDKTRDAPWIRLGVISSAQADAVLAKYKTDQTYLRLGLPLKPSDKTFSSLKEDYLLRWKNKSPSTVALERWCLEVVEKHFPSRFIHQINEEELSSFLSQYAPNTHRLILLSVKHAFNLAVEKKWIERNPFEKMKHPKLKKSIPKFRDPRDLDLAISYMSGSIRAYFEILRYTGMRPSEALNLKSSNVKSITYREWKTGKVKTKLFFVFHATKTDTDRAVPIHKKLIATVNRLRKTEEWFPIKKGMTSGLRRACKKAGLKGINLYSFRHTFATEALAKGGSPRSIQELLGHQDPRTTDLYMAVLKAGLVETIDAL